MEEYARPACHEGAFKQPELPPFHVARHEVRVEVIRGLDENSTRLAAAAMLDAPIEVPAARPPFGSLALREPVPEPEPRRRVTVGQYDSPVLGLAAALPAREHGYGDPRTGALELRGSRLSLLVGTASPSLPGRAVLPALVASTAGEGWLVHPGEARLATQLGELDVIRATASRPRAGPLELEMARAPLCEGQQSVPVTLLWFDEVCEQQARASLATLRRLETPPTTCPAAP